MKRFNVENSVKSVIYDWKRYWLPYEEEIGSNYFEFGKENYKNAKTLEELRDEQYLILLGDAALGKTTSLNKEKESLDSVKEKAFKIDFKDFSTDFYLQNEFEKIKIQAEKKDDKIYLLVDSFDEGHKSFDKLVNLFIKELKELPLDKIYLRIVCRTVVYPELLENRLNELVKQIRAIQSLSISIQNNNGDIEFKKEKQFKEPKKVKIINLLPLNINDVKIALFSNDIGFDGFQEKINGLCLESFLSYPITLKALIEDYPARLDKNQYELYERLLLNLAHELNRTSGILTPQQRVDISSIIATLMTFANKQYISYNNEEIDRSDEQTLFLQDYVSTIKDFSNLVLLEGNIREVLDTGLFSGSQNKITFQNKPYQEFLTAYFLNKHNLCPSFSNLIFDEKNLIIAKYYNVVGWLAQLSQSFFDEVLEKDPEALFASNVKFSSENSKKLIDYFFSFIENNRLTINHRSLRDIIPRLSCDNLDSIISERLNSKNKEVVYWAMEFVEQHKLYGQENSILNILLAEKIDYNCKTAALYLLKNFNHPEILSTIQNKIDLSKIEDIEKLNRFYSTFINVLFPSYLTLENTLEILKNIDDDHFFIHFDIDNLLTKSPDFYKMFDWLLLFNLSKKGRNSWRLSEFNEKFSGHLVALQKDDETKDYICQVIKKTVKHPTLFPILRLIIKNLNEKEYVKIKKEILNIYFSKYLEVNDEKIIYHHNAFFTKLDIPFLIKQIFIINDIKTKKFLLNIILSISGILQRYYDTYGIFMEIRQIYKHKKISYEQWRIDGFIHKVSAKWKKFADKINAFIYKNKPLKHLKALLKNSDQSNILSTWSNVLYDLVFYSNYNPQSALLPADISTLSGWQALKDIEKEQIYKLAFNFLKDTNVSVEDKTNVLTINSYKMYQHLSCIQALVLLINNKKELFDELISSNTLVSNWFIYIVRYPNFHNADNKTIKNAKNILINYFFELDEEKCVQEVDFIINTILGNDPNNSEIYYEFLNNFEDFNSLELNKNLINKLKQNITNKEFFFDKLFKYIVEYLLSKNDPNILEYLKSVLLWTFEDVSETIQATSGYFLIVYQKDSWNIIKDKFTENKAFVEAFFDLFGQNSFHSRDNKIDEICSNLTNMELAELYIILERFYPKAQDKPLDGTVSQRDKITELRRNLLNNIVDQGRFKAIKYIQDNSTISLGQFWQAKAIRNYSEINYEFVSVDNLFELIFNRSKRLILNNQQLLMLILDKLNEIQKELRKDQGYLKLWNEIQEGRTGKIYFPKDEYSLSDEIKRELQKKITDAVINREVEIKRSLTTGDGQRTDLKIDCPMRDEQTATVIIEVKGCWNNSLDTSIKTQLLENYLCDDNGFKYGIYLIGWFCCELWNEENRKKRITDERFQKSISVIKNDFATMAENISTPDKKIQSFILDLTIS